MPSGPCASPARYIHHRFPRLVTVESVTSLRSVSGANPSAGSKIFVTLPVIEIQFRDCFQDYLLGLLLRSFLLHRSLQSRPSRLDHLPRAANRQRISGNMVGDG